MQTTQLLAQTVAALTANAKGILAADESNRTMTRRLDDIQVPSSSETRRAYRRLLFSTPQLSQYISGVILFEETLDQTMACQTPIPQYLMHHGMVPGIKVDKGLVPLVNGQSDETWTQGLDGLVDRLVAFKEKGARFAKWRATYSLTAGQPSTLSIIQNASALAHYAAICQSVGIVPIVEPEILMHGSHSLAACAQATEAVHHAVFHAIRQYKVMLEFLILKPSMVIAGDACREKNETSVQQVARATVAVLKRTVPAAVPSINFLSGGQDPIESTAHLAAMHALTHTPPLPWKLSFSYGRALQAPCLQTWQGKEENVSAAQEKLLLRAQANHTACLKQETATV